MFARRFRQPAFRNAFAAGLLLLAFIATHTPPGVQPSTPWLSDTIKHIVGYAVLGATAVWRLAADRRRVTPRGAVGTWLALCAYAVFDELTQPLAGRSCELADWLADAAGGSAAISMCVLFYRRAQPR